MVEFTFKLIVDELRSSFFLVVYLFLVASTTLCALDRERSLDQYSYQVWQTGSGLPQNTVHTALQSRDGYMWFATEGGLVRFDGQQFVVYDSSNTPSLKSNHIRSLAQDGQGVMWIATSDGLLRRDGSQLEAFSTTGELPGSNVLALHADSSGRIWAVTPEGLARCSEGQHGVAYAQSYVLGEGTSKLTGQITSSSDGAIWVGTETGLKVLRNERFTDVAGLPRQVAIQSLLFDRSSRLWVGTSKGLFLSRAGTEYRFEPVPSVTSREVSALFEDRQGDIWIGTEGRLMRLASGSAGVSVSSRAFPDASVIELAEDTEGDLWIGTDAQGVTIARNQKFVTYTARQGLTDDAVRCVFSDQRGVVSAGTTEGVTEFAGREVKHLTTAEGLSSNVILSLGEDRDRSLLVGTPDGLNIVRTRGISLITSADGLADDFVRSLYRDTDGSLWIGTRRGLSHQDLQGHFSTYTQADGLGSDLVGEVVRDRRGDLWIATLEGLSLLRGGTLRNFRKQDGLSSNVITALYEDADDDLWVGTRDAGLNLLREGKIVRVPERVALPPAVYGVAEDGNGSLWIPSSSGIVRVGRKELKAAILGKSDKPAVVWYGTSDGLRVNECSIGGHPEVWKGSDGTLWFSTVRGLAALYPEAARRRDVAPPVIIESITIDDQRWNPSQLDAVSPGHSRFAFEYAGLSFAEPQKVQYRYKLEGFDKHWIEAGLQRTAYYTNIPPGAYRFRVIARSGEGVWNEKGATIAFRLAPRFYQTLWFYAGVVILLGLASYLVYRWRVAEVEARFNAVLQERNRIAREIHDTLAQGFVGVSMQLETVARLPSSSAEMARQHLDQARQLVRDSLAEARRSIWQLRSQSSEYGDLASRLSKAANQTIGPSPVKLSVEVRGTYRPLRQNVEDELLRIGQEAVTNAIRHADPHRITIELAFDTRRVRLAISDDGRGFAFGSHPSSSNGHFGLQGMRERAEQIGGQLFIESAVGKGTKVSVEAPLA